MSICSNKIFVAVFSMQQYYLKCTSHHCCVSILLTDSSWDTYVSYVQYLSLSCSVSADCFSRVSMLMILLIIFVIFLTDLALTDLIFRTDSDEFVNLLMFNVRYITHDSYAISVVPPFNILWARVSAW